MNKNRIVINGVTGRMGKQLIATHYQYPDVEITAALARADSTHLGDDIGVLVGDKALNVSVSETLGPVDFDVMIDFSRPEFALAALDTCIRYKKPILIATTGFSSEQLKQIEQAAQHIPVLLLANTSIGVNVMLNLLKRAAQAIGLQSDIEIIESHHRHKVDAPSGTAVKMGEVISDAMGRSLDADAVYSRHQRDVPRQKNEIGFSAIRAANIVGEHTALFAMELEHLEITHQARDRSVFAHGAWRSALWLANKSEVGLYDMDDVLGLKD